MGGRNFLETEKQSFCKIVNKYGFAVMFVAFLAFSIFYLASRSFWIDESMVAVSIVKSGLSPFEPLKAYNQVSPWGFVLTTKFVSYLFGAGDLQFRLPGIIVYFTSLCYFYQFTKRHFGNLIAFTFAFMMLSNPLLLYYSTEFKHYVYEFSFTIFLLISYLEMHEKKPRAEAIYAISTGFSIFFGISIIFVTASIFAIEMLLRLKVSVKNTFKSKWLFLHLLYFAVFLIWYFISITPNLQNNLMNYPNVYDVTTDISKLWNIGYWGKPIIILQSSILIPHSIIFFLCVIFSVLLTKTRIFILNNPIIFTPVLIYLIMYFLNFIGKYPILKERHLLFVLPTIYLVFAFLIHKLTNLANTKSVKYMISVLLVSLSTYYLVDYQEKNQFFFQELKPVLANLNPSDKVFLYFSAQPAYNWYKQSLYNNLPKPINPDVNTISGPMISLDEMESHLEESLTKPGAWPSIAKLTKSKKRDVYHNYLANLIIGEGKSKVVFSHRSDTEMRNLLLETCNVTIFSSKYGSYIYDVNCLHGIQN